MTRRLSTRNAQRPWRLLLVCALMLVFIQPGPAIPEARAAQTATTTTALNLRESPSTSSPIIRVMPSGATVEISGAQIGDWYPVMYDGSVGYAHSAYLRLAAPELSPGSSAQVLEALNLRAGPSTSFAVLTVMPAGATVTLSGESQGGFWRLTYNGTWGWSASQYLRLLASAPTPSPSPPPVNTVVPEITPPASTVVPEITPPASARASTTARLNLRTGPGTDFPVITVIPNGATVEISGSPQSGFYQTTYAGYSGWAFGTYLQPMSDTGESIATTTANVNLRQGPHTLQAVILVVPVGQQVILTGATAAGFHQVRYNGVTGWISSAYLTGTGVPPETAPLEIPILMYHRIASTPGLYQVTEQTLRSQMAWLAANGFTSITPDDVMAYLAQGAPLPARPIMITIDDGNSSDVLFKQILDYYGFAGVWYLTGPGLAYSDAIVRSMDGAGQVCSHTQSHLDLSTLGYSSQWSQIQTNKAWLEGIVGHELNCFAYPYGAYNQTTVQIVQELGFTNAVDAWGGPLKFTPALDPYHLTRINLSGYYTLSEFIGLVS